MEQDLQLRQEDKIRKHQILLNKISYIDDPQSNQPKKYKYSSQSIQPFVQFWKLLALKPCDKNHKFKLQLNIPDTIVFNDGDNPIMWFYTNSNGEVCRIDNIQYNLITGKLTEGALEKELVAVLKKPSYGYGGLSGNQVKLISASQIKTVLSLVLSQRSEISVIQKFVKSTSIKPSVVRTAWRAKGPHQSWILSSNYEYNSEAKVPQVNKFIVNTKNHKAFTAIKSGSQKYMKQTLKYLNNIANFVGKHLEIKFLQVVGDFIKDQGGNWWFINLKAFILEDYNPKLSLRPITMHDDQVSDDVKKKGMETYTKCKKCKYCYKIMADHFMTHTLTLMMILQCDQHLIKIGKNFPWLQRCYSQHVGNVNLYIEHKVCDSCYKLYKQIEKLVALQEKMARLLGNKIVSDNKNVVSITSVPAFKGQSPQFGSRLQKVKYDTDMPKGWALPKNKLIQMSLINDKMKKVSKCRFMIFMHGIRDIPIKILEQMKGYYLQYRFFDQTVTYKLDFTNYERQQEEQLIKIKLNKIKVLYFFSENRQSIKHFINKNPSLTIKLFHHKQQIGTLQFQLEELKSSKVIRRNFFKMFSGDKIFPYLSWGLHTTLGLYEGQAIQASKIKLYKKDDLFFPQLEYHSPDPLPQQWIQMIEQKDTIAQEQFHESNMQKLKNREVKAKSMLSNQSALSKQIEQYGKRSNISQHREHKALRKPYY